MHQNKTETISYSKKAEPIGFAFFAVYIPYIIYDTLCLC